MYKIIAPLVFISFFGCSVEVGQDVKAPKSINTDINAAPSSRNDMNCAAPVTFTFVKDGVEVKETFYQPCENPFVLTNTGDPFDKEKAQSEADQIVQKAVYQLNSLSQ